jgi:hypothetical protein
MSVASPRSPIEAGAERLLCSLTGIVSARVVADRDGHLQEVHVLATDDLHPKQVVRNVESALRAGLGLDLDRRIVSVAQVRAEDVEPDPRAGHAPRSDRAAVHAAAPVPAAPAPPRGRLLFARFDARCDTAQRAMCRVVLARDDREFVGTGEGPATVPGRAEAAARAVFAALADANEAQPLGLEGVSVVDAHGRTYVLVAACGLQGRRFVSLAGAAPLTRSPEEAAILASLQAANRWANSPLAQGVKP